MGVLQRQGFKNVISTYLGFLIGFFNLIIIQPHFLTKEEIGLTRLLYSISLLIATFVPLGIGNVTTRFFPLFKNDKEGHHGYLLLLIIFPLIGNILAGVILFYLKGFIIHQYSKESPLFVEYFNCLFPMILFNSFLMVLSIYCSSNYKSTIPAFINDVLSKVLTILVVSLYFIHFLNLNQFILAYSLISLVQLAFIVGYIFFFEKPRFNLDWPFFRQIKFSSLLRYGGLLWFAGIASLGLKYIDSILIGRFLPLSMVGLYSIAAFIPTVIEAPVNALDRIGASKIAFAWNDDDRNQIKEIYNRSSLYMLLFGGLLFLLVNANIHSLVLFLPQGFREIDQIVFILSLGTLVNMSTGLNMPILFNSPKYKYGALSLIVLAIIAVGIQLFFIPTFGLKGAALSTAVSSSLYNFTLCYFIFRFYRIHPFNTRTFTVIILIAGVYFVSAIVPSLDNHILDMVFRSMIITTVYIFLVYVLRIIPEYHHLVDWKKIKFY